MSSNTAKQILRFVASSRFENSEVANLSTSNIPKCTDNVEAFFKAIYENNSQPIVSLIQATNGEIHAILSIETATFKTKEDKTFAYLIAPTNSSGIRTFEAVKPDNATESFQVNQNWKTGRFEPENGPTTELQAQSAVSLPNSFVHHLLSEELAESIEAKTLLQMIIEDDNNDTELKNRVKEFLIQSIVESPSPVQFELEKPSRIGIKAQDILQNKVNDLLTTIATSTSPDAEEIVRNETNSPSPPQTTNTSESQQALPNQTSNPANLEISALERLLVNNNQSMFQCFAESLGNATLNVSSSQGFLKQIPSFAKQHLIFLRAGPGHTHTKLSDGLEKALTSSKDGESLRGQIEADLERNETRPVDLLLDKTTCESLFKKGDLRVSKPVNSKATATGLNFFCFGPKYPMGEIFTSTSESGNKFIAYQAKHVWELTVNTENFLNLLEWITGPGYNSYAMMGVSELLAFYHCNTSRITALSQTKPSLILELQFQTANVWSNWMYRCANKAPTKPPNFDHIIDLIEAGSCLIPSLNWKEWNEQAPKKQKVEKDYERTANSNQNRSNARNEQNTTASNQRKQNRTPQLTVQGDDLRAKQDTFRSKFGGAGTVARLNIPDFNGKKICMRYHLLHSCSCTERSSLDHSNLSDQYITGLIQKSNNDNLKISRL